MTEEHKYLFDLNGYIVIENVLSADELTLLNETFDHQERPGDSVMMSYGGGSITGPGILAYGQPFVDLLDHPAILPVLRFRLGDCFRLDRLYAISMSRGMSKGVMHSDYGASSPIAGSAPGEYYPFPLNEIHSGFTVVSWNLTDSGPGVGGFCCIPGSHKSNFSFPGEWRDLETLHPFMRAVTGKAGSAILFTEALTHGTLPWHGDERRTVFYKYSPNSISWYAQYYDADQYEGLTDRQRQILEPPNARYDGREQPRPKVKATRRD